MKLLLTALLLTISTTVLGCDKCDAYFNYEFIPEIGASDFVEVDICHDGYDVNMDNKFDLADLSWIIDRVRYHYEVPLHEDAVGDFNSDGVLSAADVCELFEEGQDEGFIPSGSCFITSPAP